jgi:hypothetical protein
VRVVFETTGTRVTVYAALDRKVVYQEVDKRVAPKRAASPERRRGRRP